MNKQNRNNRGNCDSGKKNEYYNYAQKSEININAEHITFLGNTVVRTCSEILPTTINFFKEFQINSGEVIARIDKTPFHCKVSIKGNIAIFELIRDGNILTRNFCCFGQNTELALDSVETFSKEFLTTTFGKIQSMIGGKIFKPKLTFWLYTFIIDLLSPSEAMLAGEIEFYIYDAIRRGISIDCSNTF